MGRCLETSNGGPSPTTLRGLVPEGAVFSGGSVGHVKHRPAETSSEVAYFSCGLSPVCQTRADRDEPGTWPPSFPRQSS